jgi:MFS family permease
VRRSSREFRGALMQILRTDSGFRLFLGARWLAQIAAVGSAFFTVFAVREFNMDAGTAGVMTGVLMIAQTVANPVFGLLGDRYSHRLMFAVGILMAGASAAIAMAAPSLEWFYVVFALTGFAGAGMWTTAMALTVEFGSEADRPAYIGLANTLTAPATVIAPLVGGWMADAISYQVMFGVTAISGLITAIILYFMPEPRKQMKPVAELLVPASPYVEQP